MLGAVKKSRGFKVLTNLSADFGQVSGSDAVFQFGQYFAMYAAARYAKSPSLPGAAEQAAKWSKLASTLSTVRTVGRWAGLLDSSLGLFSLIVRVARAKDEGERDVVARLLELGQTVSLLVYYPLEQIYFLNEYQLITVRNPGWYSRASCMAWLAYIVLYLADAAYAAARGATPSTRQLISYAKNTCDLPLAVHWSLEQGPLSDTNVALLGVTGSILDLIKRWSPLLLVD